MGNINPDPFDPARIEALASSLDALDRDRRWDGDRKGGNAFDAGVATAFTLQVVEPHLNGPGGDVPIIVHDVKRGKTEVICGQGPARARRALSQRRAGHGARHRPAAACVPARSSLDAAAARLRHVKLRDVLGPRFLCRQRLPAGRGLGDDPDRRATVPQALADSAAVYLPDGKVPTPERCSPTRNCRRLTRILQGSRGREPRVAGSSLRARPGQRALSPKLSTSSAVPE